MAEPSAARGSEGLSTGVGTRCHRSPLGLRLACGAGAGTKMASPPVPRKASVDTRKGSVEIQKGSAVTRKGSRDSRKLSVEMKKDPGEAQKSPGEVRRKISAQKESTGMGSKKWSSGEDRRVSIDSIRGSFESRKASFESRRGSSEGRGSSSSIPSSVRPSKVPWVTLMRALGRFKLSLPNIRQYHMLAARDPLAVDTELPRGKQKAIVKRLWGDHQPLAKIPYKVLIGHDNIVSSCHFCMNDTRILSGSYDCSVKLWDATFGSPIWDFEPRPKAPVLECSITADSRRIVASSYDKTVRAWDVETGQLLWKLRHDTFVVCCKFSPNGKFVLTALDVNRGICLIDPENITAVIQIKDHHRRSITACCFDPDSQKVASVAMDRCIKIWDITSQTTLFTIPNAHGNTISDCCFTISGHFLCTSSWDKTLKIWNIHTGEFRKRGACVTLMRGHEGCVSSCCIARDSSILISGGFDKTVTIWDVGDGYRKLSLKGHDDWVTDVAISSNKKWIISASKDNTLRLWNIEDMEKIPLVTENKRTMGCKVKQCKSCDQFFSTFENESSILAKRCMFCRREEDVESDSSSSSLEESKDS
ncbi:WD repeat-containing protein 88 [Peromyscus leucopus]|uniref:WD repeat-containing protein 88 n=1 Tax=Peromyscus leucopus TaxID=10041 RepID=UPI0010A0DB79|nr:WD repeat-containing protein 88 [Peromyscus leucopus]